MILDALTRRAQYHPLGPHIAAGLDFLATVAPDTPDGRYPIRGDEVFALVQGYHTAPGTEKRFEAHRRHLDIQLVAAGRERILYAPADALEVETPYEEESDVLFFREPGVSSSLLLTPGHFAIFHPADAHKPGCMAGRRDEVRKVVVKVRVE